MKIYILKSCILFGEELPENAPADQIEGEIYARNAAGETGLYSPEFYKEIEIDLPPEIAEIFKAIIMNKMEEAALKLADLLPVMPPEPAVIPDSPAEKYRVSYKLTVGGVPDDRPILHPVLFTRAQAEEFAEGMKKNPRFHSIEIILASGVDSLPVS